jgi:hypothetical protein
MRWKFWEKEPRKHVVDVGTPIAHLKQMLGSRLRPGMWVVVGDSVGIIRSANEFGVGDVMLTDEEGLNLIEVHLPLTSIRQAYIDEIPAARVAHMSVGELKAMGYKEAP